MLFSFYTDSDIEAPSTPTLTRSGDRHPGDAPTNRTVTGASTPGGSTWVGVRVITLPTAPDSVRFSAEVNHSVGAIPVRAYSTDGLLLDDATVIVESSVVTTLNSGFDSRRDVNKVAHPDGIGRVEVDGRNKTTGSAGGGFIVLLDDLMRWPDPGWW